LLLQHYEKRCPLIKSNPISLGHMMKEWCISLFNGYNIVVQGRQSKFRLLELFKKLYLDSDKIPDLSCQDPTNGTSNLNVITVRMHGLTPLSLEKFNHAVFGITENGKAVYERSLAQFLDCSRKTRTHYVFLIHSFELLYRDCRDICDIVFRLYRTEPAYMHILLSSDHVNAGIILNGIKKQLQLVFYNVPFGESFFYEKTSAISLVSETALQADLLFRSELDLQSVKDVYAALQHSCREVMLYIIDQHIHKASGGGRNEADHERRITRGSSRTQQKKDTSLQFNQLFEYCKSKFVTRRPQVIRNHLGELLDHKIIELDESGNKIKCCIQTDTCKKFLVYLESQKE